MSRRREIARRLEAFSDIAGIMSAMKGLALMETRILTDSLENQRRMVSGIEAAAVDFLIWHPELASEPESGRELCVVVGSEQGFCGDFNEVLLARMEAMCSQKDDRGNKEDDLPLRWVVVGRRLSARIGEREFVELTLSGAIVADEVPAVLLRLTQELGRLLTQAELAGYGLSVLYHCDTNDDIRLRRLLPMRDLPASELAYAYPPELGIPPAQFLRELAGHYLHASLNEALYCSLMAENRQRQTHMERALQRLDEDSSRLRIAYNIQRQEEITEEIAVILLSADMLGETDYRQ